MTKRVLVIKGADFSENCIVSDWQDITSQFSFTSGKSIDNNGAMQNSNAYVASGFVDVSQFSKVRLRVPKLRTQPTSVIPSIAFYTSSSQSSFVSSTPVPVDTSMSTSTIVELTLEIPSNASYIRTTYWQDQSQYVDVWQGFKCEGLPIE